MSTHGGREYVETEMGELSEYDMEAFARLFVECSEKTIAITSHRL